MIYYRQQQPIFTILTLRIRLKFSDFFTILLVYNFATRWRTFYCIGEIRDEYVTKSLNGHPVYSQLCRTRFVPKKFKRAISPGENDQRMRIRKTRLTFHYKGKFFLLFSNLFFFFFSFFGRILCIFPHLGRGEASKLKIHSIAQVLLHDDRNKHILYQRKKYIQTKNVANGKEGLKKGQTTSRERIFRKQKKMPSSPYNTKAYKRGRKFPNIFVEFFSPPPHPHPLTSFIPLTTNYLYTHPIRVFSFCDPPPTHCGLRLDSN